MNILDVVLLLAGALAFLFAVLGFGVREKLIPLGLLLWICVPLAHAIDALV